MNCQHCGEYLIEIESGDGVKFICESKLTEIWRTKTGKHTAVTEFGELVRCEFEPVPFSAKEMAFKPHKDCKSNAM